MKKLKLNFYITAYNYFEDISKCIYYKKEYDETLLFDDVLKDIYDKFSLCKLYKNKFEQSDYHVFICNPNLFETNYKFKKMKPEPQIYNYYNVSLKKLEIQFNLTKKTFKIWLDPCIGGAVGCCRGIHFFFHTNEKDLHHIPHIHCKCANEEFRVNLKSIKIIDKPFKNKKRTKVALEIIELNKEELLKYWYRVVIKGESVKFKMYLPCR